MAQTLSFNFAASTTSGTTIGEHHFGVNLVGQYESVAGDAWWNNFDEVHARANATTIRWPGGQDAEYNHEEQVHITQYLGDDLKSAHSYLDGAQDQPGDTSFAEALDFAKKAGIGVSFVIPTQPLIGPDGTLKTGQALVKAKAELKTYLEKVISMANKAGVDITAFEIGNEYWGLSWQGTKAYAYGAASVAKVLDEALGNPSPGHRPDVLIQAWGTPNHKSEFGEDDLDNRNDNAIVAFQDNPDGDLSLIDGISAHFYYMPGKTYGLGNGQQKVVQRYDTLDERIDYFAQLNAAWEAAAGKKMGLHFTEWNVQHRSLAIGADLGGRDHAQVAYGLKQLAPMLEMFSSMIANGTEAAQIWSALYHPSALATNPGRNAQVDPDRGYGLNVAGQFFATELTQLEGYQYVELAGGGDKRERDFDTHLFTRETGGTKGGVMYLSSLTAIGQNFDLNLFSLMAIPGTVSVEIIGIKDADDADITFEGGGKITGVPDYLQPGGVLERLHIDAPNIKTLSGVLAGVSLGAYEVAKITFDMYETTFATTNGRDEITLQNGTGSKPTDDFINAKGGNDWVQGGAGRDYINGGRGNDALYGGYGADILLGGNGNDYLQGGAGEAADAVHGGAGDDKLFGGGGNDQLFGGADNDTIQGGSGEDTLGGGTGADQLKGGAGDDLYILDHVSDRIFETSTGGNDTMQSSISLDLQGRNGAYQYVENVVLTGRADLLVHGTSDANVLTGNAGANLLNGRGGNDTLDGGTGADQLKGGAGDDLYILDHVSDRIVETSTGGNDTMQSSISLDLQGRNGAYQYVENVVLTGRADLLVHGTSDANVLTGNAGANLLNGRGGNDTLDGGAGADRLKGGAGQDTFVFTTGDGSDTIIDFELGQDKVLINGTLITDLENQLVLQDDGNYLLTYGEDEILFLADGNWF